MTYGKFILTNESRVNAILLMSLAWSNLNRTTPDPNAAGQYAEAALRLVPEWHYVRDVLMPQIRAAQAKAR
jgi:hypothetical protein